jgi:hypothetical protein
VGGAGSKADEQGGGEQGRGGAGENSHACAIWW